MTLIATSSQTVGPFFHFGLTAPGTANATPLPAGVARLTLTVSVHDGDDRPVDDAAVEIFYRAEAAPEAPCLFARLGTGDDGSCTFELARPAAQVNVCVFARGLLRHLHTRIYFEGDSALRTDPVLALVPEGRRGTLLARREQGNGDRWRFDIRLQGADETVFFDL